MIGITLVFKGREMDILIPNKITMGRFKTLVREMFSKNGISLPDKMTIEVHQKSIQISDYDRIADFGIATGDMLEIKIGE